MTISVGPRALSVPDSVYLDASLLVDARASSARHHRPAAIVFGELLRGAALGRVRLYISPLVVDELWWALARVLYEDAHGRGAFARLTDKASKTAVFSTYAADLAASTSLLTQQSLISVVDVRPADIRVALGYVTRAADNLRPRDAFHLAIIDRLGIAGIVSSDRDFTAHGIAVIDHRR
jgi:predicted nucleic acid-binding protein